ncbi:MAG: hypothetical protein ACI4RA_00160, partial [Kiritimatiellia bacterium]
TNKSEIVGNTSVTLADNARLLVKGVYGANPATGEQCLSLVGAGGTLAANGAVDAKTPFLSGCVGRLEAGGLRLDTRGFDLLIDQDFTATAADAAFVKAGVGDLTVLRGSDHPRTRVEAGALVFGAGVARFGRTLELAPGAVLAPADASAVIGADAIVYSDVLAIRLPADYELDVAHPILALGTTLTAEQLARVIVANPTAGRGYAFSLSEDGKTLRVTVSAAATGTRTWTGAAGATWNTAENWTPVDVPTHNDTAVIERAAAITLEEAGAVGTLEAPAAEVSVTGDAVLQIASGVAVATGGTLTLAAPVRSARGAAVEKAGSGTLVVDADNAGMMAGDWRLARGVTEFASAKAVGMDADSAGALTLSNCTFRYTGAEAATVRRPWRLDGEFPAVIDNAGDLTFSDFRISFLQGDAGIAKIGAGTLTLDFPRGTTTISTHEKAPRKGNADPSGHFAPVNGEVGSWDGLGQLSVLEGRLTIKGQGKAATTVKQEHHGALGGGNWAAKARPELYLKDVTMYQGSGNGFHLQVDQQVRAGSPASSLVLDNANMVCNGIKLGFNKVSGNAEEIRPSLAITNGTLDINWSMEIPADVPGISPIVRVGPGGRIRRDYVTAAGGITFTRKIDARFEDGGFLEVAKPQNLYFGGTAEGALVFARGGGMKVHRFLARNTGDTPAAVVFDGGSAEFTLDGGVSTANRADTTSFRAAAGGGELIVAAGKTHALAVPLKGPGAFTKSGAGTLVLTNDLGVAIDGNNLPVYTEKGTCTVKVANAGGVRVAEGTLACVAGATDAAARFSGTGTLTGSFGASFTLDIPKEATDGLTLADVDVGTIFLDFGYTDEAPAPSGESVVVAKVPTAEAFGAILWRPRNLGEGKVATLRRDAATGVVTATFKSSGFAVFIR